MNLQKKIASQQNYVNSNWCHWCFGWRLNFFCIGMAYLVSLAFGMVCLLHEKLAGPTGDLVETCSVIYWLTRGESCSGLELMLRLKLLQL